MRLVFALMLILCTACSCVGIKYEPDQGFVNSAQANSLELAVRIGKSVCKDMDGVVGICSKRVTNAETITFYQPAMPYGYRFVLTCSQALESDFAKDIPPKQEFSFAITPDKFSSLKSFICIGEIFPTDRDQQISAKWEVRVKVSDSKYIKREDIYTYRYKGHDYLVLGQNAKYARVFINGYWYRYTNTPVIKLSSVQGIKAMSESEMMRFNYLNYEF